jgi:hypothetical protein
VLCRCALDCNKVSDKQHRTLRSTPDLLEKAPDKLTCETPTGRSVGVKVTGAYSMEARQPSCEYLFRYVARGVSLVVELFALPSLYLRLGRSDRTVTGDPAGQ